MRLQCSQEARKLSQSSARFSFISRLAIRGWSRRAGDNCDNRSAMAISRSLNERDKYRLTVRTKALFENRIDFGRLLFIDCQRPETSRVRSTRCGPLPEHLFSRSKDTEDARKISATLSTFKSFESSFYATFPLDAVRFLPIPRYEIELPRGMNKKQRN